MKIIHYLEYETLAIAERNRIRTQAKINKLKKSITNYIRDFIIVLLVMSPLLAIALYQF